MVGNKIQETLRHTSYLSLKRDAIKRYTSVTVGVSQRLTESRARELNDDGPSPLKRRIPYAHTAAAVFHQTHPQPPAMSEAQ